jgi:general secretion pathway protein M
MPSRDVRHSTATMEGARRLPGAMEPASRFSVLAGYCTARSWTRAAEAYADRAATRRKLIIGTVVIREVGQPLRGYVLREAMRLLEALHQRVEAAVAKAGGALISSQVELDGPDAKNGFVSLTASMEVSQPAVQAILYDIEAGMPYLFVDKLSIQSREVFGEPESGRMRMTTGVAGQWRSSE